MARESLIINTDTDIDNQLEQFRERAKKETVVEVSLGKDKETGAEFVFEVYSDGRENFSWRRGRVQDQASVFSIKYPPDQQNPKIVVLSYRDNLPDIIDPEQTISYFFQQLYNQDFSNPELVVVATSS